MSNPLLNMQQLPEFSKIKSEQVEPVIDQILQQNRKEIAKLLTDQQRCNLKDAGYNWDSLLQPLEDMDVRLNRVWSAVSHLMHVRDSKEWRQVYQNCIPKLTAYATELRQNAVLYKAVNHIQQGEGYKKLNPAQRKIIENSIRDFKLAGVHLPADKKQRLAEINEQLAKLTHQFEENVLDATGGWTLLISDQVDLAGMPEIALAQSLSAAKAKKQQGWLLTLEYPCYHAVITYVDNRQLREQIYTAYVTRASDQGPQAGKWDNSQVMIDILNLRHEEAQLLGFSNYAELSLATNKMAKKPEEVITFLQDLVEKSKPVAEKEWQELSRFAKEQYGVSPLQPWDVAYYSEKLRLKKHDLSQEELRPYFPEDKVLQGLFSIVEKLYGITIKEQKEFDKWHDDVRFFTVYDQAGSQRAAFYLDLYARSHKRGGAWMDGCSDRHHFADGMQQIPVTFVTCNFAGPSEGKPSLLTHEEVLTLLHEFGHALHHMLTKVNYASVAGTNGVDWDVVELPSQFMEHWGWAKESVPYLSQHYKTREPFPDDLYARMYAAKDFQAGMQMVRQLEFALFDFKLHLGYNPEKPEIQTLLDQVRAQVAVVPVAKFNRFQHGFSHIFGGAYAAGYYSYKWAELLSCDAFTKFEEQGIFDEKTGREFLHNVLEVGGVSESLEMFVAFRGRKPNIDALLRHNGIVNSAK